MTLKGYRQTVLHVRRRTWSRLATLAQKPKPVSRRWLVSRYITQRLNCEQIGAMLGRDPKTIWTWLKYYGIPTRPRGAASSPGTFRKGQVNPFSGRHHTLATREKLRMIALADGRVPYDPAVGSYMKGRTGAASTNWRGGISPERQAFYASEEWRAACKAVWARADARCERCKVHHNTAPRRGTFHVHHIIGFAVHGLRAEPSNLALLCKSCHLFVHSKLNAECEFLGKER